MKERKKERKEGRKDPGDGAGGGGGGDLGLRRVTRAPGFVLHCSRYPHFAGANSIKKVKALFSS